MVLIAVLTCHKFRYKANVLRETWVPEARALGIDVRFFVGQGGEGEPLPDEVWLDRPDDYMNLRLKTQAAFGWAAANGYEAVFKTDDDVLIIPDRLLRSASWRYEYAGRVRAPSRENVAPQIYGLGEVQFCSGFGYWLSQRAAKIVAEAPDNGDWAEDRFTGNTLVKYGIHPHNDSTVLLWPPLGGHFCTLPNPGCAACQREYCFASVICPYARPEVLRSLYQWYRNSRFVPTNV